jgi:RNA polymerase sigma factor (sigma-70 family)
MLDQRRAAAQPELSREELFAERYEILLGWAMNLTHQQRESAEDLVQDAFVQFMLARTQLEEIENINGYLRRLLRNMYLSRVTRLTQRLHDSALTIADYDTFRLGWTAIEPPRRMQAAEQLHQICAYACFRKESSRAGSVLILRFFLDYFPTEIASVLSSSRHCVDQWQRLARREAKVFLSEPKRLRFVDKKTSAVSPWTRYPASDCDLMLELRAMIFSSRHGACMSREELQAAYTSGRTEALSTTELAHIVSCRSCLDTVNAILGLPLLAERYPAEDCSREEPPRDAGGSGGSGGNPTVLPKRFKRQLREIREHKPSELRIVVNGDLISSVKISSDLSEFDLNLPPDEPVEFVEILSEQDIQLLFLSANDSVSEQWAEIELSESRTLELCLQTIDGPTLRVVYNDPVVEDVSPDDYSNRRMLPSPLTIVRKARAKRWLEALKHTLSRRPKVEESGSSSTTSLSLLGQSPITTRTRAWTSPAWLTVLIAAAMAGAFLLYKANLDRTPTATNLLAQAIVAETDRGRTADRVAHRSINLEIRRSSEGALISRHTINSWENYDRGQRIQRLYDENGKLIAASTVNTDGSRTLYHHNSKLAQPRAANADSLLLDLDGVWQLPPSIHDYNAIIADSAFAIVEERATDYLVTFAKERVIGASRLVKATLTLRKSDLHPIEQTLVVQRGEELREYKFVETEFELVPTKDVPPSTFEIDAELAGKVEASSSAGKSELRNANAGPLPSTSTPAFASTELEIDVAYLLNQVKADRNEQVALTRSASGSLRVEGVVDTAERRDEFLRALRPFSNNPAVIIEIHTVAEAAKQEASAGRESVREVEDTGDAIAVEEDLRRYFSHRGLSGEAVDEAVRSYSSRVVDHGYRALFQAIELKRLVARFSRVDLRTVAPDARSKWVDMMRSHALAFARENAALRHELQPVFLSETAPDLVEDFAIDSDADLARAVDRLHRLAIANNDAIRQAFTISKASSASAFKSAQFRRNLEGAARLSDRISQY